jgi:serine/threonine protein kinase
MVDAPLFEPGQRCGPYTLKRLLERGVPELYLAVPADEADEANEANKADKNKSKSKNASVHLQCADIRRTGDATPSEAQWSATIAKLSALSHPLIPKLLDAGVHEGHIRWIASELALGSPFPVLGTSVARSTLGEALAFGLLVANAMAGAQKAGVAHGNLGLRSVVVTEPGEGVNASIRLIGLGSAELFGVPPDIARRSPLFRAPEQLRGEAVDARSDMYSLGMILYALIARRPPFWSADDAPPPDLLSLALNEVPPPLADIAGASEIVSDVIGIAIRKQPGERFPDWLHFGSALNTLFRYARADAASRSKDEKLKTARERAQDAEAHYIEAHPEREGVQSGFRALGLADLAALEEDGARDAGAKEDNGSPPPSRLLSESPRESPPPSTQKSGAQPHELPPSPPEPTPEPTPEAPAPPPPRAPEPRDPRLRRALIYSLTLLLAGAAVGGFAGIALATRSLNAHAEVATTPLALAALLSLGAPEASWSPPDSPPEVRSPEPQEPALSAPSSTSERDLHRASPVVSRPSVPIGEWEPSRRVLVRTAPASVDK